MPIKIASNNNRQKLRYSMVEPSFDRIFSSYQEGGVPANKTDDKHVVDDAKCPIFATINLIFAVVLVHLLLLWFLQIVWRPSLHLVEMDPISSKAKKVNAYIIYQPAAPLIRDSIEPSVAEIPPHVIEQSKSQSLIKVDTQTEKPVPNNSVKQAPTRLIKVSSADNKSSTPSVSVNQFTQGYLEKQRLVALNALVANEANIYTQNRSLSEMDGDMEILQLRSPDEFITAGTLDSHIDPNRIVKQGDICYRIVKVGTVLNPHAENLGYPFKCGGQTIQQALKAALDKRLAIMGVKK